MTASSRYILQEYANKKNLKNVRSEIEDKWFVAYPEKGVKIELAETNSHIENEYSLHLTSANYLVEGTTELKEAMIHHHKKGHKLCHLQFKITALKQTVRIFLDQLDEQDYERCIKGFLYICQDILRQEGRQKGIKEDLQKYFFNDNIRKLSDERIFLLGRIRKAFGSKQITADDKVVENDNIRILRSEQAINPFLGW